MLWVLCMLGLLSASAQKAPLDSLRSINIHYSAPRQKLDAIRKLSASMGLSDFNERKVVAEQGIYLAAFLKDSIALGDLYKQKGLSYYFQGQYDSAAHYYYLSINILETQKAPLELGESLNVLGRLYRKKREYPRSLNAYDRAMNIFREVKDSSGIATIYNESGVVYEYMGDYDEAMRRYRASLNIQQLRKDEIGISYSLSNIGYLYITLEKYADAEKYLMDALRIRVAQKDSFSMALNYSELGELCIKDGRYAQALDFLRKSNAIAIPMHYLELQMNNYRFMSDAAEAQGNYREAFYRRQDFEVLKDSIYRLEVTGQIEEISTRYETEKKAAENELLRKTVDLRDLEIRDKENRNRIQLITAASMAIIFFMAVGLGLLVFFRIRREQQIRLQTEVATARDMERRRISRDLHDNLGAQMTYMISMLDKAAETEGETKLVPALRDTAGQAIMTLRETVWAINRSEISVENFSDKFKQYAFKLVEYLPQLSISVKEDITENHILSPSTALNLYRLCQEAFSNAVKHAAATEIRVNIRSDAQHVFYFSVVDNGKGFDPEKDHKEGHYGLENMRYRAEEAGAKFTILSEPGKGSTVEVFLPVFKQNQV